MMMRKGDMDLLDWYAGLAMKAFISANDSRDWDDVAEEAYEQAESMMDHRHALLLLKLNER